MPYIDKDYILSRSDGTKITAILNDDENDTKLNLMIADAEAIVNGKIGAKYVTPIAQDQITGDIKRIVLDIVLYFIYGTVHTDEEMEALNNRYNRAMKSLDNIALGYQNIKGAAEISSEVSSTFMSVKGTERKYTKEYLDKVF